MCGICGLVALDGSEVDATPLAAMSESLRHRGPDSEGSLVDGPVALAARRLSIIDLEGGDQPVGNEDGSVKVVQNGEIYNYRELRAGLERRGHRFSTQSDTEVLVHLYEEHGPTFVRELRGMFALALWDSRQRRLVLARDRFGIKPLYYGSEGGLLSFASELKALPRGEVDLDALEAFLTFNSIPAPLSIWRGTLKLPAGHLLVWEGKSEPRRYRPARCGTGKSPSWPRSSGRGYATPSGPISSLMCRSASSSPGASTPEPSPPSPRSSRASACRPSRSVSRRARSTSSPKRARWPSATTPTTTSSSSSPMPPSFCRSWRPPSMSPSQTRPRYRPTWSPSWPRVT